MSDSLAGPVAQAIARATAFLLAEAAHEFPGLRHEMIFPRAAGFTPVDERQIADVFGRATMANLLLDMADLSQDEVMIAALRSIARREADYVARAKIGGRAGGWSYFPGLPELPPDLDSLAAALSLFARIAPEHLSLCAEPVALALAGAGAGGEMETWIVAPGDPPDDRQRMEWAIDNCWGRGTDVDVLANFHHALFVAAPGRHAETIRRGAAKVIAMQRGDGAWAASWYSGFTYAGALCLRLLRETGVGRTAIASGTDYLRQAQAEDGSWGAKQPQALDTACGVWGLAEADPVGAAAEIRRGVRALLRLQTEDGGWPASPWIQMQIGRATGYVVRVATHENATITTALCLKALLLGETTRLAAP